MRGLAVKEAEGKWGWRKLDVDIEARSDLIEELLYLIQRKEDDGLTT